jgi:hypothetical protein
MIRRDEKDGYFLISQLAHARLAAAIAAAVGNEKFAAPLPRGQVLRAIELHDEGWSPQDEAPTVNQIGQPTDVFEMPLEAALPIWAASTDCAMAADPYAGLLVSLHGLALSQRAKPRANAPRSETFAMIKFQHAQIEIQESLRAKLGMRLDLPLMNGLADPGAAEEEDLLRANFRLLEFADLMSLNLCYGECRFPTLELGQSHLRAHSKGSGVFFLEPWPFKEDVLELEVKGKRLARRKYGIDDDLRPAWSEAVAMAEPVSLVRRW